MTATVGRTGTTRWALSARWVVPAYLGALTVTTVGVLPRGLRANSGISVDHAPDGWTQTDLLGAVEGLGLSPRTLPQVSYLLLVTVGLLYLLTAVLVWLRAPTEPGARTVAVILAAFGWAFAGTHLLLQETYPQLDVALQAAGMLAYSSLTLLLYVFPDGRFVPRWTAWAAAVTVAVNASAVLGSPMSLRHWPAPWRLAFDVASVLLPAAIQVYRYRYRSDADQRRRTRAVAGSLVCVTVVVLLPPALLATAPALAEPGTVGLLFHLGHNALSLLAFAVVPVVVSVAVLRLRLWDLDPVLNAALVYATLTALVAGAYASAVAVLSQVFREPASWWLGGLAAGVVAVLFDPARRRVQRAVDRLMYGRREDPYAVLAGLGGRLEGSLAPEDVVHTLVTTVQRALQLPWVRIELLDPDGRGVAAVQSPPTAVTTTDDATCLPLVHRGQTVARLSLPPLRTTGRRRSHDLRLVQDLCRQAGAAVYAARAAGDLRRARERVVAAREEERRRLRRDLHDGLGPSMAAVAMTLDTAEVLVDREPDRLPGLLAEARRDVSTLMSSVRDLAHGLYPPALDQLGLVGALQDHGERRLGPAGVRFDLQVGELPSRLPAAVESAAYLLACEAMTNVARHASATRCRVALTGAEGRLSVTVEDDGVGTSPERREGVGLQSMRERTAELGGRCEFGPGPGGRGVAVVASLPLTEAAT